MTTAVDRLRRWFATPIAWIRRGMRWAGSILTPSVRRWIWRGLTLLSLLVVTVGILFSWQRIEWAALQFAPEYLALALGIYVVTYVMQMIGWHTLVGKFFGPIPFRENAHALAGSALLKYLPTIAWYIANRVDFYERRQLPRGAVIAASLLELVIMVASAASFYVLAWLGHGGLPFILLGVLVGIALLVAIGRPGAIGWHWWHRKITPHRTSQAARGGTGWLTAIFWYAATWPLGILFYWAILHAFTPLQLADLSILSEQVLLSSLAGYVTSLTLGAFGIAREITLTVMVSQYWPLPAVVASAIMLKIMLNIGEIGCSLITLGILRLLDRREAHD